MDLFEGLKAGLNELAGTALELREVHAYNELVKKYDEPTAEMLMRDQLQQRNITLTDFRTYLQVKKTVQHHGLGVSAAVKEATESVEAVFAETLS